MADRPSDEPAGVGFLKREPQAERWFRRWLGADEFLNGYERWCLWLGDCPPDQLRKMPEAMKRVEGCDGSGWRASPPTRKLAETPTRFHVENRPGSAYLVIPEVSSERRAFVPMPFLNMGLCQLYLEPDHIARLAGELHAD